MKKGITIENCEVGSDFPPFIIAEISGNHNQSLERALNIVEAAADTGVSAIKLQTYTPDTMTLNLPHGDFVINDKESLWNGRSLYDLYQEAHTPWEWHRPIFDRARELGLIVFSTPFDATSVDFLEDLKTPCYKIASFENCDLPLIRKVASTGKPVIISTGMATMEELDETLNAAEKAGCENIILLKCTSSYPATPHHANILTIPHMKKRFRCEVGLSDHTLGLGVSVASIALGAAVIEKHFTLSRKDGGVDAAFSLEPAEMRSLVQESKRAWQSLGDVQYGASEGESNSLKFRRSIYIVENMEKGELLTQSNMKILRPGYGLPPKNYDHLIGRRVKYNLKRGSALSWDIVE